MLLNKMIEWKQNKTEKSTYETDLGERDSVHTVLHEIEKKEIVSFIFLFLKSKQEENL